MKTGNKARADWRVPPDARGLLNLSRRLRRTCRNSILFFTDSEYRRRRRVQLNVVEQFRQRYGGILQPRLGGPEAPTRRALVVSRRYPSVEVELSLIKALELAGFEPVVLIMGEDRFLRKYYELASVTKILFALDYTDPDSYLDEAAILIGRCQSAEDLLEIQYGGARVGKIVFSTALRRLRVGSLDLQSEPVAHFLVKLLASAMASIVAAQQVLQRVRPNLMLSVDIEYMPQGELFDVCMANGVDTIKYETAHRINTLIFKRYTMQNRDDHFASLSTESWREIRRMDWTNEHREQLSRELRDSYSSGDWYGMCGTQFNKSSFDPDEIRSRLSLDPQKKNAFIFPHILWDSSLTWGKDLFRNYEDWLVETLKAACANDQVNWIIKIHPAHVGKSVKDGFEGEPAEITVIRKHIGSLPRHISIITPESEVSTFSLFDLMDYCITVRGTIGIEAATFGIPVLTAGTGRYDQKGFTIDSKSREQYLNRIGHIQDIPRLDPIDRELAERFAYGTFLMRPLRLTTATFEYAKEEVVGVDWTRSKAQTNIRSRLNIANRNEWYSAPDLTAFAQWVRDDSNADLLFSAATTGHEVRNLATTVAV